MSVWDKLDPGLTSVYANYLRVNEVGAEAAGHVHPVVRGGGGLNLSLQYTGDLGEIERLGFTPLWDDEPGRAGGSIDLADLERIAAHPGVVKLSYGRHPRPALDKSIPDVRANQVWSFSSGAFGGTTGSGAIVAVIDTGIDFNHPYFRVSGPPETRILRIWDQGLEPEAGETGPDPANLTGPAYGVEYNRAQIVAAIGGAHDIRHRDCNGHGTHVASIAAGSGRDEFKYIGVAPEAELIVVKLLYPEKEPTVGGVSVDWTRRFQDAITYAMRVAKNVFNKPVVINCSFGSGLGPHDGFSDDEDFLTNAFNGAVGQVVVSAAGNDAASNQHARIVFAGAGTVTIPIALYDDRTKPEVYDKCRWEDDTDHLWLQLYYPTAGPEIAVAMDYPDDAPTGFVAGPARGGAAVTGTFSGRTYNMTHSFDDQVLRGGRGTIHRRQFQIEITPLNLRHDVGTYQLRITSPGAQTIHLWLDQGFGYGLKVDDTNPLPAQVNLEDKFLISSGAANTLTIAAYDAEAANLAVADFSSRGPLVSYGPGPVQPPKPDLAAPGEHIDAAHSSFVKPKQKKTTTAQMGGTSMAAPHVAGAVALMLQKKPALTIGQVIATLKAHRRTAPPAPPEDVGAGRLDAKDAFDNVP